MVDTHDFHCNSKLSEQQAAATSTSTRQGGWQLDNRENSKQLKSLQNTVSNSRQINSLLQLQKAVDSKAYGTFSVIQRVNEELAAAAESLNGKFNWTLPGGLLEYKTILDDWPHYRGVLLENTSPAKLDLVGDLCVEITTLLNQQPEGFAVSVKDNLDLIKANLSVTLSNDGGEEMMKLTDDFSLWLSTGWEPAHMNCWEAVIYAAARAGIVSRGQMLDYIRTSFIQNRYQTSSEQLFRKFLLGRSREDLIEADWEEDIPDNQDPTTAGRGDILCFWEGTDISHVAIHTGDNECMSLWAGDTLHFTKTAVSGLLAKYDHPHLEIIRT